MLRFRLSLTLTSTAFAPGGAIPSLYTCEGQDAPDPTAPKMTWVHWLLYFHKLYALDVLLGDLSTPDKRALQAAMHGHIIASAEPVGTYQKHVAR